MDFFSDYKNIKFTAGTIPKLYIVEEKIFEIQKKYFKIDKSSKVSMQGNISDEHSDNTFRTIFEIVKQLKRNKVVAISQYRNNISDILPEINIPEALFSVMLYDLLSGDVLIVNLELVNGKSLITSKSILELLKKISEDYKVCVIVAAGNKKVQMNTINTENVIVVGGLGLNNDSFEVNSNYGDSITCYTQVPITLNTGISFGESSAATAQITGLVLLMQKYANSKGRYLNPAEVKQILSKNGQKVVTNNQVTANIPYWEVVKSAIDAIIEPKNVA